MRGKYFPFAMCQFPLISRFSIFKKNGKCVKHGFTLIELLVVMTIMVFLFTAGYSAYRDFTRRQVLYETANVLRADLQLAQQKANAGERPDGCTGTLFGYIVSFTSTAYELRANCSSPALEIASDPLIKATGLPASVTIRTSPAAIYFNVLGEGTTSTNDDTIELVQPATGQQVLITVTRGGSIY